jgi:hypothetical protein
LFFNSYKNNSSAVFRIKFKKLYQLSKITHATLIITGNEVNNKDISMRKKEDPEKIQGRP